MRGIKIVWIASRSTPFKSGGDLYPACLGSTQAEKMSTITAWELTYDGLTSHPIQGGSCHSSACVMETGAKPTLAWTLAWMDLAFWYHK